MSSVRSRLAVLCLATALAACGDSTEPSPRPATLDLAPVPDTVGIGDSLPVVAWLRDASGEPVVGATVSWTSRAPDVLAADASGWVRALSVGDAWLVASVAGRTSVRDSVRVHVREASRSLVASVARDSLSIRDTVTVRVLADEAFGAGIPPGSARFTSSDTLAARVDSLTGLVRILGDGDATITVTAGARRAFVSLGGWLQPLNTSGVRLTKIAAGFVHACGLDEQGAAWCWGANEVGQLGRGTRNGTQGTVNAFGAVTTSERFVAIAAGRRATCGITLDRGLVCWGSALVGRRPAEEHGIPTRIALPPGFGQVTQVDVGVRPTVCAIDTANRHVCLGDNSYRAIGPDSSWVVGPRPVPGAPAELTSISTGEMHGCGTTPAGAMWCWGDDVAWKGPPFSGTVYTPPAVVAGLPEMRHAAASFLGTCALDASGGAWCGGSTFESSENIARASEAPAFVRFSSGMQNDCGLTAAGELWCRDSPHGGFSPLPMGGARRFTRFSIRHRFTDFSAGDVLICGITTSGTTVCRGSGGGNL